MHTVNRQAIVKHESEKMYNLVNAIESYPIFLKWCSDSCIIENNNGRMLAGLTVSLAGIKQEFTTENTLTSEGDKYEIALSLIKGPFDKLLGTWKFIPLTSTASKIELYLEFNFKSGILNSAFKRAFGRIAQQLVTDFVNRANYVYR